jgi:hypothetical protein
MEDEKSLCDYGLTSSVAKAQQPAEVGLAFRSVPDNWFIDLGTRYLQKTETRQSHALLR